MGSTTNLALPYPAPTATPDVPFDLQQLAEAIDAKLAKMPRCKITANPAGQAVVSGTLTTVDFAGGTIVYDTLGNMADLANDQIVVRKTGFYILHARVGWANGATGYRAGLITRGAADFLADDYRSATPSQTAIPTWASEPVLLTNGDLINLKVQHTQGSNLNLTAVNGRTSHLALYWLGGQ